MIENIAGKLVTLQKREVMEALKSEKKDKTAQNNIDDFLDKWAGFFSKVDTDDTKYNYLMEKHQ